MPYVTQEFREIVNLEINALLEKLHKIDTNSLDGEVNYTITRIIDSLYGDGGYSVYNRAMGVLDCVAREFYRRRVAPYEDSKAWQNGDVY